MQINNQDNNFFNKEIVFFLILYLSLLVSFIFGENSTGGAILDYLNQKKISINFALDFKKTLINYDQFSTRHSPILIIILSYFEKIGFSDFAIRLIHLHICLLFPLIFYKCLDIKFKNSDKKIFLFLTSIIFLSPTFRSLSIWPDSRMLGITVFALSVYFYLRFLDEKKFIYIISNIFTCAASAYLSPNFSVFSIFFFFVFINIIGFKLNKIIPIIFLNIILSFPAIYYIFILDVNFLNKSAAIGIGEDQNIIFVNLFNNILITFSIIFFYLLPFLLLKIIKIKNFTNYSNILISLLITIICSINFDYNFNYSGGGIFFKLSYFFFKSNYLFYFISFISILIVLPLLFQNKINLPIFILILLNNPQYTIYHKYFDPFFLIAFFMIFKFELDINKIKINKKFTIIFFYFLCFLIISNLKLLWKI